jgi:hypothetical protein
MNHSEHCGHSLLPVPNSSLEHSCSLDVLHIQRRHISTENGHVCRVLVSKTLTLGIGIGSANVHLLRSGTSHCCFPDSLQEQEKAWPIVRENQVLHSLLRPETFRILLGNLEHCKTSWNLNCRNLYSSINDFLQSYSVSDGHLDPLLTLKESSAIQRHFTQCFGRERDVRLDVYSIWSNRIHTTRLPNDNLLLQCDCDLLPQHQFLYSHHLYYSLRTCEVQMTFLCSKVCKHYWKYFQAW